jgi:hypothetical protein
VFDHRESPMLRLWDEDTIACGIIQIDTGRFVLWVSLYGLDFLPLTGHLTIAEAEQARASFITFWQNGGIEDPEQVQEWMDHYSPPDDVPIVAMIHVASNLMNYLITHASQEPGMLLPIQAAEYLALGSLFTRIEGEVEMIEFARSLTETQYRQIVDEIEKAISHGGSENAHQLSIRLSSLQSARYIPNLGSPSEAKIQAFLYAETDQEAEELLLKHRSLLLTPHIGKTLTTTSGSRLLTQQRIAERRSLWRQVYRREQEGI